MNMIDPTKPINFLLPDGDVASVITWEYTVLKLEENLSPIIELLAEQNKDLKKIDNKLKEWNGETSSIETEEEVTP